MVAAQLQAPELEVDLELGDPFLSPSCLPNAEAALSMRSSSDLASLVEGFIEQHADHRSPLDYLVGLTFPLLRAPMRAWYADEGPSLPDIMSDAGLAALDRALARTITALTLVLASVPADELAADDLWRSACCVAELDAFWFA